MRFGNRAESQLQLDIYGEVIDALYQAREEGIADTADTDHLLRMLAAKLEQIWHQPGAGIWESRGKKRQHTYSKVMCWVAFDRAAGWLKNSDPELANHYREARRSGSRRSPRERLRPDAQCIRASLRRQGS